MDDLLNYSNNLTPEVLMTIQGVLNIIEQYHLDDSSYYRILSLSAVFMPELFSENFLKVHFDFLSQYLNVKELSFSNSITRVYSNNPITTDSLFLDVETYTNLELTFYNVIPQKDDYVVYICDNVIQKGSSNEKITITKKHLIELYETSRLENYLPYSIIIQRIVWNLMDFYHYSIKLQNNSTAKKTILDNISKLITLQRESYREYLIDVQLLSK